MTVPPELPVLETPVPPRLPPLGPPPPPRRVLTRELAVFLLILLPSLVLSVFAVRAAAMTFVLVAAATIFQDAALVSLVVFFFWRNEEGITALGWRGQPLREALVGVVLFVPTFFAAGALESFLSQGGMSAETHLPSYLKAAGTGQMALAAILVVVVAVAEETIFRGYLLRRLGELTASPSTAVLLSAAIFSLGHAYEGTAGMLTVAFLGVVFALVYLWRGSLVAPVVMHMLQDMLGLVVAPLLSGH